MPNGHTATSEPIPVLDLDPFSDAFLTGPDPYHEVLREAGPVVYLERYGVWAMARYAHVHEALRDHETYCSSAGVGISDFRKEKPWRPPSLLLEADPPAHDRARRVAARALPPRVVRELRPEFLRRAEELVRSLLARGSFDAVPALAEAYPLRVFGDAAGLPAEGRENLLAYGTMVFNVFGPRNRVFEESTAAAEPVRAWIAEHCEREALSPDGLGARIWAAVDTGEISREEAALLVRSLFSAGVDTTVSTLAAAVLLFATHPRQWEVLRTDPSLAGNALEEVIRYASPVQTFFRTTTREVEVEGRRIPAGEKVLLFLGAANRDPRQWDRAGEFDITRRIGAHVGFGSGIHNCVGAAFARVEGEALVSVLARRVTGWESTGDPIPRPNNTLRAFASLPVRIW
ncbi:MAG: cytochrome P450 [Streptosporangiales bacterium]|nr:cytochrome P450 [Streptosporangiales bacterium]